MTKRQKSQKNSFVRCFSLLLVSTLLLVPFVVLADPLVLVRTTVGKDMVNNSVLLDAKLSAALQMNKYGDMEVQCLNLFSIPVARTPFGGNPGLQKLVQRTRLNVEPKGSGVLVKLSFMF
jgi:hypothetical protein